LGVDESVFNAFVAEQLIHMEDVFGFMILHGRFEVSKRFKGDAMNPGIRARAHSTADAR
jgi:hypothetical protein